MKTQCKQSNKSTKQNNKTNNDALNASSPALQSSTRGTHVHIVDKYNELYTITVRTDAIGHPGSPSSTDSGRHYLK
jgi:hypothetical protein